MSRHAGFAVGGDGGFIASMRDCPHRGLLHASTLFCISCASTQCRIAPAFPGAAAFFWSCCGQAGQTTQCPGALTHGMPYQRETHHQTNDHVMNMPTHSMHVPHVKPTLSSQISRPTLSSQISTQTQQEQQLQETSRQKLQEQQLQLAVASRQQLQQQQLQQAIRQQQYELQQQVQQQHEHEQYALKLDWHRAIQAKVDALRQSSLTYFGWQNDIVHISSVVAVEVAAVLTPDWQQKWFHIERKLVHIQTKQLLHQQNTRNGPAHPQQSRFDNTGHSTKSDHRGGGWNAARSDIAQNGRAQVALVAKGGSDAKTPRSSAQHKSSIAKHVMSLPLCCKDSKMEQKEREGRDAQHKDDDTAWHTCRGISEEKDGEKDDEQPPKHSPEWGKREETEGRKVTGTQPALSNTNMDSVTEESKDNMEVEKVGADKELSLDIQVEAVADTPDHTALEKQDGIDEEKDEIAGGKRRQSLSGLLSVMHVRLEDSHQTIEVAQLHGGAAVQRSGSRDAHYRSGTLDAPYRLATLDAHYHHHSGHVQGDEAEVQGIQVSSVSNGDDFKGEDLTGDKFKGDELKEDAFKGDVFPGVKPDDCPLTTTTGVGRASLQYTSRLQAQTSAETAVNVHQETAGPDLVEATRLVQATSHTAYVAEATRPTAFVEEETHTAFVEEETHTQETHTEETHAAFVEATHATAAQEEAETYDRIVSEVAVKSVVDQVLVVTCAASVVIASAADQEKAVIFAGGGHDAKRGGRGEDEAVDGTSTASIVATQHVAAQKAVAEDGTSTASIVATVAIQHVAAQQAVAQDAPLSCAVHHEVMGAQKGDTDVGVAVSRGKEASAAAPHEASAPAPHVGHCHATCTADQDILNRTDGVDKCEHKTEGKCSKHSEGKPQAEIKIDIVATTSADDEQTCTAHDEQSTGCVTTCCVTTAHTASASATNASMAILKSAPNLLDLLSSMAHADGEGIFAYTHMLVPIPI